MTPEAKLRMDVYQEGQRAYSSGAPCPYSDWRAGTWQKGLQAAMEWHADVAAEHRKPPPVVQAVRSAGWIIRRTGPDSIAIESRDGSGTGIKRAEGDVFYYFDALLKEYDQ